VRRPFAEDQHLDVIPLRQEKQEAMTMNAELSVHTDSTHSTATEVRRPSTASTLIRRVVVGVVIWAVVVVAFQQLWQRGFGFSAEEAWALSIGLMTMIGMLIGLMLIVATTLKGDV
jgi:hypothetical protein